MQAVQLQLRPFPDISRSPHRRAFHTYPGRDDAEEVKLYTRADVNARSAASGSTAPAGDDPVSALIVEGLGGTTNLSDVDCCATRLRCTVKDAALVRQDVSIFRHCWRWWRSRQKV